MKLIISIFLIGISITSFSQNPIIRHIRTADPSAHVWDDGKVWIYASHDQDTATNYKSMDGYHVFSSSDMVNWTDHGEVLHSRDVSWGTPKGGLMFAPDCAYKNGTYYFYYPHMKSGGGWRVGVATSDKPEGPFTDIGNPIEGTDQIDPCCFVDDDGQAYLYWGGGRNNHPKMAKLKDNMIELAEEPRLVDYGDDNFLEGAWVHKRNGKYYFSYFSYGETADKGRYAIGDSPYGPFTNMEGMCDSPSGAQVHHSMVEFKNQWFFFYHVGNYNDGTQEGSMHRRNVAVDKMYYNEDGTIQKLNFTEEGITSNDMLVNPICSDAFTADPAPFIGHDGKLWLVASHDKDYATGYDMEDYVFMSSSDPLGSWDYHGTNVHHSSIPWITDETKMWAPSAIYKDGTYFLYYPLADGLEVGLVTASSPLGPWKDTLSHAFDHETMDPHVFIDDDGEAYMVGGFPSEVKTPLEGSGRVPFIAKMNNNMLEYDGEKRALDPSEYISYSESSWLHKHNGKYYYSYKGAGKGGPKYGGKVLYCMSDNVMGPYEYVGEILPKTKGGNGANHHAIIEYENQWYLFTHSRVVSDERFRRNAIITTLEYNEDGTIKAASEADYNQEKIIEMQKKFGITESSSPDSGGEQPENVQAFPGKTWTIPGNIEAIYFDAGGEGKAYHDLDNSNGGLKLESNPRFSVVGEEGVDIELGNIGWIANGEWVQYTINSVNAGKYTIRIEVATNKESSMSLTLNDHILGTFNFPSNGSYKNYQYYEFEDIMIDKAHTNAVLKVLFNNSGFNFKSISFVKTGDVSNKNSIKDNKHALGAVVIYPNPVKEYLWLKNLREVTNISLCNNLGQILYNKETYAINDLLINTSKYAGGLYFLNLKGRNNIHRNEKIIVQR